MMTDDDQQVRRGLLARVLFELLRDAATPEHPRPQRA